MKKIIYGVIGALVVVTMIVLTSCQDSNEKYVDEATKLLSSKQYEESLASFKKAIDSGVEDEEVKTIYGILEAYLEAEELFAKGDFREAQEILNKIDESYINYSVKEDVEGLIKRNDKEIEYLNESDDKLLSLEDNIKNEKYKEADMLISELEKRKLNDEQQDKLNGFKEIVAEKIEQIKKEEENQPVLDGSDITDSKDEVKDEENSPSEDNNSNDNTDNGSNNGSGSGSGNSTNTSISKDMAIQLAKNFMSQNGDYIPSVVKVDNEETNQYIIHAYDVIDNGDGTSHTATSGWYYVDKATGKVTSMF